MKYIVKETIDSLKEYLPRLMAASNELAEFFQSGKQLSAINQLPNFLEGLQWVMSAFAGIQKNGYFIEVNAVELNKYLIEMEEALTFQDYVLISDLLEYEITPKLEEWHEHVINIEV